MICITKKLLFTVLYLILLSCNILVAKDFSNEESIRVPLRGGAIDIHFTNLTSSSLNVKALFYNNGNKTPIQEKRNLLFIPNEGSGVKPEALPISFSLSPAFIQKKKGVYLKAQQFIQSILIYNNISTYDIDYYNGGYNRDERYTTYSSYMWSQGVRAPDDGMGVFSNAISELSNIKYNFNMDIDEKYRISMDLIFKGISNLKATDKTKKDPPELKKLKNIAVLAAQAAAITKIAGGIVGAITNPPAGVLVVVSGAFNEVQAITQYMINSYLGERVIVYSDKGHSWLSTPFDILVKPEKFYIKNKMTGEINVADYNVNNGQLLFFLGNNAKPQYVVANIRSSEKGDLFISFISSSAYKAENTTMLLSNSEFVVKE